MKHWFKDQHFRSLLKNSSYLAISRVVAAIAGIATLSLAAHGLGVLLFGALILLTSYAKAVSGLSKFQSWQLIVRYGGRVLHGNPDDFKTSTGFAFALDAISGVGGMLVAVAICRWSPHGSGSSPISSGWRCSTARCFRPWAQRPPAACFGPSTASISSAGKVRLRRSPGSSWWRSPIPRMRLSSLRRCLVRHRPRGRPLPLVPRVARTAPPRPHGRHPPTLRHREPARRWRFAIHVNLTASVQTGWGPISRLIVGGLLGPAAAALFRVASTSPTARRKPAELLAKAFYPEVVRMDLTTKKPWKLMLRVTALAGGMALLAILILVLGGSRSYLCSSARNSSAPTIRCSSSCWCQFLGVLTFPLPPMLYALDRPDAPLKARLRDAGLFRDRRTAQLAVRPHRRRARLLLLGNAATALVMMWQLKQEHRRVRPAKAAANLERRFFEPARLHETIQLDERRQQALHTIQRPAFGPSDMAFAGSGWVSMNRPETPVAPPPSEGPAQTPLPARARPLPARQLHAARRTRPGSRSPA